jgi:TRAP-type C4-dicarboxylate transport system substrate-binding protein
MDRRGFVELSAKYGFTATAVAMATGTTGCGKASVARVSGEEQERKRAAQYTMNLATNYILGASRAYPIMQLDMKENIQNCTKGKVYVKLAPGGQLGTGSALVQKVQTGTIQAAQHSIANFAPFAPAADVINLPYWCGENQKFINLVTSDIWKREINPKVEARGFKPLWYVTLDPRTVALRNGVPGPIKTPDQLRGIKFRVGGSNILLQFYQMLGANADALDPCVEALLVFGFKDVLSSITFNGAVPDAQVYSCNLEWFRSLPSDVQEGIEFASEISMRQNHAKIPAARAYTMAEMEKAGVEFYHLNADEKAQWIAQGGAHLPAWDTFKKELVGSLKLFDQLEEAANTPSPYYVHDA